MMATKDEGVELAQRIGQLVVYTMVGACEEAGIQGLCGEGRFEYAIDRVRYVGLGPRARRAPADAAGGAFRETMRRRSE